MPPFLPRIAMAPEGDAAGGSAAPTPSPAAAPPPAAVTPPAPPAAAPAPDEGAALKAKIAKLEADDKKRDADKRTAERAKADADAASQGKAKEALEAKERELVELREKADRLEAAARARLDKSISKLPDVARAEIEMIKDTLSTERLEAFVEFKLASVPAAGVAPMTEPVKPAPPAPSPGGVDHKRKVGHELNATTVEILQELGKDDSVRDVAKNLGVIDMGGGDSKWRWQGTGDDRKDTLSFIGLLNSLKPDPHRFQRDAARKRALGVKE